VTALPRQSSDARAARELRPYRVKGDRQERLTGSKLRILRVRTPNGEGRASFPALGRPPGVLRPPRGTSRHKGRSGPGRLAACLSGPRRNFGSG
jgi:hypothetical protein